MLTQQAILDVLKTVKYPGYSRDVVSFGLVKGVAVNAGAVSVSLQLTGGNAEIASRLKADIETALRRLPEWSGRTLKCSRQPARRHPSRREGRCRSRPSCRALGGSWP